MTYNEDQATDALHYLATTSELYADAVSNLKYLEHLMRVEEADGFLRSTERTIDARKAYSRRSPEMIDLIEKYREALRLKTEVEAKREQCHTLITWVQSKMRADSQGRM